MANVCAEAQPLAKILLKMTQDNRYIFAAFFKQCGGQEGFFAFAMTPDERRSTMGKNALCYESTEHALIDLLDTTLPPPARGTLYIEIVAQDWTLANYAVRMNGKRQYYGGEPGYSYSRELGTQGNSSNIAKTRVVHCGDFLALRSGGGLQVAVEFTSNDEAHLGEIQMNLQYESPSVTTRAATDPATGTSTPN